MKKFIVKIIITLFITLLITAICWRAMALYPDRLCAYTHEVNIAHQASRLKNSNGERIIIIGGSGCGFGICSPMIAEHFSKEVFNTGTTANLGLRLQLNIYKEFVSKGDIVVVIPEYQQFMGNYYLGSDIALRILTTIYPKGYKTLNLRQQLHLAKYVPRAFEDAVKCRNVNKYPFPGKPCYENTAFNDYGDVELYDHRKCEVQDWKQQKMEGEFNSDVIELLQDYNSYCNAANAQMLIAPPAYMATQFNYNKTDIDTIWKALKDAGLPTISTPIEYRTADSLHFDTDYHLTYEGTIYRTTKLISDIEAYMEGN